MREKMKNGVCRVFVILLSLIIFSYQVKAEELKAKENSTATPKVIQLGEVKVEAQKLEDNIEIKPGEVDINLEDYKKAGTPHTILDLLKDRAIIDFRGSSDLSAENDDIQMRGFDTRQFTTAIDGLAIQKAGGWWGGHFVDYSIIPFDQIESIEILPGPHSALYEGKSFAGVLNIKTKAPIRRKEPGVKFKITNSYASLNTYDNSISMVGGGGGMDYNVSWKDYHTDGYLKNSASDLTTISGRMAWLLPSNGYISILGSYSDKSNEIPCENDPEGNFYDDSYPVVKRDDVSSRWRDPNIHASRDKSPHSLRFNWHQPSEIGEWTLGAYYSYEDQAYQNASLVEPQMETFWTSLGAKIQNDFSLTDNHLITFGIDTAELNSRHNERVVNTYGYFIQDEWQISRRLSFKPGFRYDDINIWWNNDNDRGGFILPENPVPSIKRNYHKLMPKAFATYKMNGLADFLRDTSLSFGLSKVWTPRATCEVCTWGSGVEMEPVKGYGSDLILMRRLWRDITLMVDYSHYEFDDYVVWAPSSTDYFQNSPWRRRMVGLDDVVKEGIEMEFNGNLLDSLSINVSFAYVDWKYDGPKGGIEEMSAGSLSNRAKYRINSGITYNPLERLQFHLDYKHQDKQVREVYDIIDEDAGEFEVREVKIDSYGVMDFSVAYQFLDKWHRLEKPTLKLFVNNVLDKDYVNVSGLPATERTYGASLNFAF